MMNEFSYEQGMAELETIVRALEKGDMPLEESFQAFERGMALSDRLKKILEGGDARIRELTAQGEAELDADA